MSGKQNQLEKSDRVRESLLVALVAIGLTMWFWLDLWLGGAIVGGDIAAYYLPQKKLYAESLLTGTIPLWNHLVGFGYPFLAESQTGHFYPPHLILYSLFDWDQAYAVNHLLHYVFAFLGIYVLSRSWKLNTTSSLWAALIFVYGWFPPRCCWEWAIITGSYLPWALWLTCGYFRDLRGIWLWGLSAAIGLQLLAGHFQLSFLTLLSCAGYAVCFWFSAALKNPKTDSTGLAFKRSFVLTLILFAGSLLLGILLASVQLLPTWELKQNSQRHAATELTDFEPGYGHIPPEYLTQIVYPWSWYRLGGELPERLQQLDFLAISAGTNPVEAQLYFGILPLLCVIPVLLSVRKQPADTQMRFWFLIALGLFGLIYSTGWLIPLVGQFPGFSWFRGPGRYGILTCLAVAVLAGLGWQQIAARLPKRIATACWAGVFVFTLLEFSWVSQQITYAFMVPDTAIRAETTSPIQQLLANEKSPPRIWGPGQNSVTLTGLAAAPVYLGIGPQEYFQPGLTFPEGDEQTRSAPFGALFTESQLQWLQEHGITHVLGFAPPTQTDQLQLIWTGVDPLLNSVWGRQEPLYLSRLVNPHSRAEFVDSASGQNTIIWKSIEPDHLQLEVKTAKDNQLILRDLFDPSWNCEVDGSAIPVERVAGLFRQISISAGTHQVDWKYEPLSYRWGQWLSLAAFTIWFFCLLRLLAMRRK